MRLLNDARSLEMTGAPRCAGAIWERTMLERRELIGIGALIGVGVLVLQNVGLVPTVQSSWNARKAAVTRQQDLAEIERLHHLDVAATLSGDMEGARRRVY